MKELKQEEKLAITGGAVHWGIISAIGGAITFIIGFFDGIYNPNACRR